MCLVQQFLGQVGVVAVHHLVPNLRGEFHGLWAGIAPIAVSSFLRDHPGIPNAHRVFNSKGESTIGEHLSHHKLTGEGLGFHPDGRPLPGRRLPSEELAQLFGLDVDPSHSRMEHFRTLLNEHRFPMVAQQVESLLRKWESLGGPFSWGSGQETNRSLTMWAGPAQ